MKALTLYQPWATLVAIGAKSIETRSWQTHYRGPLAIHAGLNTKYIRMNSQDYICDREPFYSTLTNYGAQALRHYGMNESFERHYMPRGFIIAICELTNCIFIPRHPNTFVTDNRKPVDMTQRVIRIPPPEPELSFGDYTPGRYAWILINAKLLPEPIPAKGSLGLWEWVQP